MKELVKMAARWRSKIEAYTKLKEANKNTTDKSYIVLINAKIKLLTGCLEEVETIIKKYQQ
jgi:hypothetical protein